MMGLSGPLMFDTAGLRTNFNLDILKLDYDGLKTVGLWNSTAPAIEWFPYVAPQLVKDTMSLRNTTFRILISMVFPNFQRFDYSR